MNKNKKRSWVPEIVYEDYEEGGLTDAAGTIDAWAWHESAMGKAEAIGRRTEINYVPVKTSWLSNGFLKSGAVNRDPLGIVKVQYIET